ncbi:lysophospholipid acyltransferase family protein [Risungbinella massiliensis]|uniref:lysophospholipid acyltransferase family protein n=1 Tax=Risungbinella massiliensis TaxID=1329796 RepID=UPI00069A0AE2|nr:lysophospholipid acyltransferase family protein [Risungbinella massiliensis]
MFYRIMKRIIGFILTLYHRIDIEGLDSLPTEGKLLVVGNHVSYLDPFYIGAILPRKIHFMARAESFQNPITRWALNQLEAFPVDRSKADVQAVRKAIQYLDQEKVVGLFPEGGIRDKESLEQIKQGAAFIALRTNTPVIPVYIEGTIKALGEGNWWIRPAKIQVRFGSMIEPKQYTGKKKEIQEKMSMDILEELRNLRNQIDQKQTG